MSLEKITDWRYVLDEKDHGKVIRVGKRGFVRYAHKDMPYFWENKNDGVVKTDQGWKEYKLIKENGEDVMLILGYEK